MTEMSWRVNAVRRDTLIYAAITIAETAPEIDSVVVCVESGSRYRVTSIALPSNPLTWEQGRRALQLEPVGVEGKALEEGMHLALESKYAAPM